MLCMCAPYGSCLGTLLCRWATHNDTPTGAHKIKNATEPCVPRLIARGTP